MKSYIQTNLILNGRKRRGWEEERKEEEEKSRKISAIYIFLMTFRRLFATPPTSPKKSGGQDFVRLEEIQIM